MPASELKLPSLTGLRFFAALAVVLYHLRIYFSPIGDGLAVFGYGFTAVSFFFVLSGFVLTWSQKGDVKASRFYLHRFARIWPLHLLTMLLAIWAPALPTSSGASVLSALPVATLTQAWIPASPSLNAFNGVSWSLSCEAFFYLLFPLLFKNLRRSSPKFLVLFIVPISGVVLFGVLASITSVPAADYLLVPMPLFRLGEFVLGVCLARLMQAGWRPRLSLLTALALQVVLTAGLFAASFVLNANAGPIPATLANLIMVPGFLSVIAACAKQDIEGRTGIIGSPALTRLGQWSFALYLIHEVVLRVIRPWTESASVLEVSGLAASVIVISVAAAGVLHEFVERPLERNIRSWPARLGSFNKYSTHGSR
ncbi:peptidoglycan/LPS O-acetylase OafA/YrhL [Arthrobacter sp. AG258]|uniref:acyltransferase family protein n=1 Tax=Arthrobacter sp. AG258 TaxID=2183899 RepID=UPI001061C73A|nr:acyltransferase [Arthrobacter sp. AG258]TDT85651.1 peptidoglycan/LPS O-acetylase OafA/YrhL [Arthrobacter sp. AG258]